MRRLCMTVAGLLLAICAVGFAAPAAHRNEFGCTASPDSTVANPGTTNLYKLAGASCPATIDLKAFVKIQSSLSPACAAASSDHSTDLAVTPGQTNAYVFTAQFGGQESLPSNCLTATTPTFFPGTATVTTF